MDLINRLLRFGVARPHVLVVAAAGATTERLAIEAELTRRGWPVAISPADTDILAVAGAPGVEMASVIEQVWAQVPAPRARVAARRPDTVPTSLDAAAAQLVDLATQRRSAPTGHPPADDSAAEDEYRMERAPAHHHGADSGGPAGGGGAGYDDTAAANGDRVDQHQEPIHDGGAGGHEHHGGHAHHSGGMELPGGLWMADLGEDRDGLMLDRLHVPLGPVLPDWPAGLVVDTVLQGDVVQEARLRVLGPAHPIGVAFWGPAGRRDRRREVARCLDGLARFLGVAGWPAAASTARLLRDDTLGDTPGAEVRARVDALVARVRGSRTLRRMLRGIHAGDIALTVLLSENLGALHAAATVLAQDDPAAVTSEDPPDGPDEALRELQSRLVGAELAAARLIVAAVDPDLDMMTVDSPATVHPDGHRDD